MFPLFITRRIVGLPTCGKWVKGNLEFLKPTPEDRVRMAINLFPDIKKDYTHDELEVSLDIVNDLIKIAYGEDN